jgi:NADH pyrophosphatase NudC (nudix superfamily)
MHTYTVKPVVCDYGVYDGDELKLILNSKRIADTIVTLLQLDEDYHRALQRDLVPVNEVYTFTEDDDNELSPFERFKQAAEEVLKNSSEHTHTPAECSKCGKETTLNRGELYRICQDCGGLIL